MAEWGQYPKFMRDFFFLAGPCLGLWVWGVDDKGYIFMYILKKNTKGHILIYIYKYMHGRPYHGCFRVAVPSLQWVWVGEKI